MSVTSTISKLEDKGGDKDQRKKIKVVKFPVGGRVVWFDYPEFVGKSREDIFNNQMREGYSKLVPFIERPSAPMTWTSKWDRYCLDAVMHGSGIIKVGYDDKLLKNKTCSLIWATHPKGNAKLFFQLQAHQRFNHIPGSRSLTRKDSLAKTLKEAVGKKSLLEIDFFPETYCLPEDQKELFKALGLKKDSELGDPTLQDKRKSVVAYNKRASKRLDDTSNLFVDDLWILKPAASSKGSGIKIVQKDEVFDKVRRLPGKYVVQKYINPPYLIDGKKFDLRLYVLVTSFSPLRVYMFPDGLTRFCTEDYNSGISKIGRSQTLPIRKNNLKAHLTNTAVNNKSKDYDADEEENKGSKWSYTALLEFLQQAHGEQKILDLQKEIKDLVVRTCIASTKSASKAEFNLGQRFEHKSQFCFELLGVDIILDSKLKPWLLEVNLSPSLSSETELDRKLKATLLSDIMFLVGVPYKSNNNREQHQNHYTASNEDQTVKKQGMIETIKNTLSRNRERTRQKHYNSWSTTKSNATSNGGIFRQSRNFENWDLWKLKQTERDALAKGCEEFVRKGHFERIFPPEDKFRGEERYNQLLQMFPNENEKFINNLVKNFEDDLMDKLFKPDDVESNPEVERDSWR